MSVKIDLTGQKYGKLTVIGIAVDDPGKKKKWICCCDCGRKTIVAASNLRSGHTTQCLFCGYNEATKKKRTHGASRTPIYYVWNAMINRCNNPEFKSYKDYGGRGIRVCSEWEKSAVFIKWALENGYKDGLEIDRIDVEGDYCPENCRWITRLENANNKRNNKVVEHNGEFKTLAEWARYYNVNYKNLSRNLLKGYTLEDAVTREKNRERTHRGSKNWLEKNKL